MRVRWTIDAVDDLERISEVREGEVQVLRLLHGAQQWPIP